jgi:hypothetical protein
MEGGTLGARVLSLIRKLSPVKNNRTPEATLSTALVGVAESITTTVANFKAQLDELLVEAVKSAQTGRITELSEFTKRINAVTGETIESYKAEIDCAMDAKRRELKDALEKLCASATDELELLKRRALASIDEHLSRRVQELESLGASSLAKAKDDLQRELNALDERSKLTIDELLLNFEVMAKKRVGEAVGTVRNRVEEAILRESSHMLEAAKTDLNKVVEAGRVMFDERMDIVLEDASKTLGENTSKAIADAQHAFAEMIEESKKQLRAELSAASGDIMSAFAQVKARFADLKRFEERQAQIQRGTVELSTRLSNLEWKLEKHGNEMSALEKGLMEQLESAKTFSSVLNQYVARTQERIETLSRRTEQTFRDWEEIIADIPNQANEVVAKGYSQALVDVRARAVRDLNLVTRGLHIELEQLEQEIRGKIKTIQEAIAIQERAVRTVANNCDNNSLSKWVEELLGGTNPP